MASGWDEALNALGLTHPEEQYDPFAAEKFANPAVKGLLEGGAHAMAVPGQLMAPNPYPAGSEEADAYARFASEGALDWAHRQAVGMLTGGGAGAPAVSSALTAGANWQKALATAKAKPSLAEEGTSAFMKALEREPAPALPSKSGYTLSSAAGEGWGDLTAKDYYVHGPSGEKIGELTHNERVVTSRDASGEPLSWLPASWTLDMPGVAPKGGTSLEELMRFIPGWHQGAQKAGEELALPSLATPHSGAGATPLSDEAIDKLLAKNPGASIFDLAGVEPAVGPYSTFKPVQDTGRLQQFGDLGPFPSSVPYAPPENALQQGYSTPAVHGTRLSEASWLVPGGEKTAWELGGLGAAHEAGLDALRLPGTELGVHFGTPAQAHEFTSNVLMEGYLPRTYPTVLQTGKSLELPDMGTWKVGNIKDALEKLHNGSGHGVSHGAFKVADANAHVGEFPYEEWRHIYDIAEMRKYLSSKGYDSINYINKVEGPGQRSYIMFKPSPVDPSYVAGVRSRFAKFDPEKMASPLLAAGLAGVTASPILFGQKGEPYVQTK